VDDVRHQGNAPVRSGGLPGAPAAEPPFGSPPYGVPPSGTRGAYGRSPYPYAPAPFVPPHRTARFGSPYPRTAPYPAARPHGAGAPPRWGRGLPVAVITGITALVLAGVVTLVVLISHATSGVAPGTAGPTAGERQVITTRVDDGRTCTFDTDTDAQAQDYTVFAAIRFRPGTQIWR